MIVYASLFELSISKIAEGKKFVYIQKPNTKAYYKIDVNDDGSFCYHQDDYVVVSSNGHKIKIHKIPYTHIEHKGDFYFDAMNFQENTEECVEKRELYFGDIKVGTMGRLAAFGYLKDPEERKVRIILGDSKGGKGMPEEDEVIEKTFLDKGYMQWYIAGRWLQTHTGNDFDGNVSFVYKGLQNGMHVLEKSNTEIVDGTTFLTFHQNSVIVAKSHNGKNIISAPLYLAKDFHFEK